MALYGLRTRSGHVELLRVDAIEGGVENWLEHWTAQLNNGALGNVEAVVEWRGNEWVKYTGEPRNYLVTLSYNVEAPNPEAAAREFEEYFINNRKHLTVQVAQVPLGTDGGEEIDIDL